MNLGNLRHVSDGIVRDAADWPIRNISLHHDEDVASARYRPTKPPVERWEVMLLLKQHFYGLD